MSIEQSYSSDDLDDYDKLYQNCTDSTNPTGFILADLPELIQILSNSITDKKDSPQNDFDSFEGNFGVLLMKCEILLKRAVSRNSLESNQSPVNNFQYQAIRY